PHAEVDQEGRQQHGPQRPVQERVNAATKGTLVKAPQRLRIFLRRPRARLERVIARRLTRRGGVRLGRGCVTVDLRLLHARSTPPAKTTLQRGTASGAGTRACASNTCGNAKRIDPTNAGTATAIGDQTMMTNNSESARDATVLSWFLIVVGVLTL